MPSGGGAACSQLLKQVSPEAVVVDTEALRTRPVVDWYKAVGRCVLCVYAVSMLCDSPVR
jgi:hypothetical protein